MLLLRILIMTIVNKKVKTIAGDRQFQYARHGRTLMGIQRQNCLYYPCM